MKLNMLNRSRARHFHCLNICSLFFVFIMNGAGVLLNKMRFRFLMKEV